MLFGIDWFSTFNPAAHQFIQGGNPYGGLYVNPPWLLPLLVPFALLPPWIASLAINLFAMAGLTALSFRLRKPWLAPLIAASYVFFEVFQTSNVDGFVLWGLALGGPVGFFLLTVKPQVAAGVGLLWLWEAWKAERWRGVLKLAGPTAVIALVFTVLYPAWPLAMFHATTYARAGTVNLFPWLMPVGLGLLAWALRTRRPAAAAAAATGTTLASPYLLIHSYVGALTLLAAEYPWLGVALVVASWVWFYFWHFTLGNT